MIKEVVGFDGKIQLAPEHPNGAPQKLLDITKFSALGWHARIPLKEGIAQTYRWCLENQVLL